MNRRPLFIARSYLLLDGVALFTFFLGPNGSADLDFFHSCKESLGFGAPVRSPAELANSRRVT
jgi:hypothetical protein